MYGFVFFISFLLDLKVFLTGVGTDAPTGTRWLLTQIQENIHRFIWKRWPKTFAPCAVNLQSSGCAQSRRPS